MGPFAAGSLVLIPFPFSDLSRTKLRPAVILATIEKGDCILCQITSQPYDTQAIELDQQDFSEGSLQRVSYARPGKLFTAHDSRYNARPVNSLLQPFTGCASKSLEPFVAKAISKAPTPIGIACKKSIDFPPLQQVILPHEEKITRTSGNFWHWNHSASCQIVEPQSSLYGPLGSNLLRVGVRVTLKFFSRIGIHSVV